MDYNKAVVIDTINKILGAVQIHKSFLTTFVAGDGEALQQIETQNTKVNIHCTDGGEWGINFLGILNTIISTIVDDTLFFIADEHTGILKEVIWESQLGMGRN